MNVSLALVEHSPRLQCANFFILFSESFVDSSTIKINLKSDCVIISLKEHDTHDQIVIDLTSVGLQININSLCLLIIKNNLVSFRVNTNNFQNELVLLSAPKDDSTNFSTYKPKLNIHTENSFRVICANCTAQLSDLLKFQRFLELPSENMDISDWFCHRRAQPSKDELKNNCNHSETDTEDIHSKSEATSLNRCVRNNDLLYGNFCIEINIDHLKLCLIDTENKTIHCKRCFKHIGEQLESTSAAKLWDSNFKICLSASPDDSVRFFSGSSLFSKFMLIIQRILFDFQMLEHQIQKLLFHAKTSDGFTKYLFIQIVSKTFDLLKTNENRCVSSETQKISLHRISGFKCLFRCETNADQALVCFWQRDINVSGAQISTEMFECVEKRLLTYAKCIPERYRENNGFYLSYLIDDF